MRKTSSSGSASAKRAMLYLTIAGLALVVYAVINGQEGFMTSVVKGWETRTWPSAESHSAYNGTVGNADLWWWPHYVGTWKSYHYNVDGIGYNSSNYDVHGSKFAGTRKMVTAFQELGPSLTVYFNPEDPSEAVLKQGISFDRPTVLHIRFALLGMMMTLGGLVGRRALRKRLTLVSPDKD